MARSAAGNSTTLTLASGIALPGEAELRQAVEIFIPGATASTPRLALVCLPGGGMNRRFYDLMPPDAPAPAPTLRGTVSPAHESDDSFSFARQMAARGFVVVLVDHLGIGESSRPQDGYALTAELVAEANANVIGQVLADLRAGALAGVPAMPTLKSIGVGHSMGAMLTVLQQARHAQHAALALLGFGTRGLPEYLKPEVRELAQDTAAVRAERVRLARDMFQLPYPRITRGPRGNGDLYGSGKAEPRGVDALKAALDPILPVPAFMSMLPGNVAPEAARIEVPLFLGIGERDMVGPPHEVPLAFTGSRDVTLHILPETGHSHFLFPTRLQLFDRLAGWARSVVGD